MLPPASWSAERWSASQLNEVVHQLMTEFPERTELELKNVIYYCEGAVRPHQGIEALASFSRGLLRYRTSRSAAAEVLASPANPS